MEKRIIVQVSELEKFCQQILVQLGLSAEDAQTVTVALLDAELRGLDTHGVIRLVQYANLIKKKIVNPRPQIKVINESSGHILLDADFGLGFLGGVKAMTACINKAKIKGLAVAGVRNSSHFGAAGYYARLAAEKDLIGMATSNSYPVMAPPGFVTRTHGNNPAAWAFPAGKNPPLVLDMATSVVSQGKMKKFAYAGQKIPLTWAFDQNGQPTDDPVSFFLLAPIGEGGYKGYGMAMVLDALAGVLTGSCFARQFTSGPGSRGCGHFFMTIDPQIFMPLKDFKKRMDEMISQVKEAQPMKDNQAPPYIPGERGAKIFKKNLAEGICLSPATLSALQDLGRELNMPFFNR